MQLTANGVPEISGKDQGSLFTSYEFTKVLREAYIRLSMDGRGLWTDKVRIQRLWKSLEYERVYLRELETGSELRSALVW